MVVSTRLSKILFVIDSLEESFTAEEIPESIDETVFWLPTQ